MQEKLLKFIEQSNVEIGGRSGFIFNTKHAKLEWQWDGGHVPSEIFGESLALYVDEMYGQ